MTLTNMLEYWLVMPVPEAFVWTVWLCLFQGHVCDQSGCVYFRDMWSVWLCLFQGHVCDQCGRGFRQKGQLRMHLLRHADKRRHQCRICQKAYFTKSKHFFVYCLIYGHPVMNLSSSPRYLITQPGVNTKIADGRLNNRLLTSRPVAATVTVIFWIWYHDIYLGSFISMVGIFSKEQCFVSSFFNSHKHGASLFICTMVAF